MYFTVITQVRWEAGMSVLDGFSFLKELVWGPVWYMRILEISAVRTLGM